MNGVITESSRGLARLGMGLALSCSLLLIGSALGQDAPAKDPPAPLQDDEHSAGPAPSDGPLDHQQTGMEPVRSDDLESPQSRGALSNWVNPTLGHLLFRVDFKTTWYADEHVSGQPANLGYVLNDLTFSIPIWQDSCDEWSITGGVRNQTFHTDAILPDTGKAFPDDLWNIRLGGNYRHQFDNGWTAGGSLHIGSASDVPFHSIEEMTVGLNAFLRIPSLEHNAWLFSLSYSPNSELSFPIPGVAYIWVPSEQFQAYIGLPFMLRYRPTEDLTFELSYMLVRTMHARASYRLGRPVRLYAGFDWSNESYFLANREHDNDRFFYYDKRLSAGVQVLLGRNASLEIGAGYEFDRFYFQGASYSDRNHDRVNVGDGPFAGLRLDFRF